MRKKFREEFRNYNVGVVTGLIKKVDRLKLKSGEVAIFWLSQNFYIIKTSIGTGFAIDPYLLREEYACIKTSGYSL